MHRRTPAPWLTIPAATLLLIASVTAAKATIVTWGINGAGGSGNWDTTTANWFDGTQNVLWPSDGDAIFGGTGGTVSASIISAPTVTSMVFNTAGYVVQNGIIKSGTSGLTVTTNADATIKTTLQPNSSPFATNILVKNGPALLSLGSTSFSTVQINQGELVPGSLTLFSSNVILADFPGVVVTLAGSTQMRSLSGGGASGGVVHPASGSGNQAVRLTLLGGGEFDGTLDDNGPFGILELVVSPIPSGATATLTNVNTYSGLTRASAGSTLVFTGNGSAANSASLSLQVGSSLVLDNSSTVIANRVSSTAPVSLGDSSIQLIGNSVTPMEQVMGALNVAGASSISVAQPAGAATQLTFASFQRNGHALLNVTGPGVRFMGLANGSTGILPAYITVGNEWGTIGGDSRITPLTSYASDINAASVGDHVKIMTAGTTTLGANTTLASLNLQNADAANGQGLDLGGHSLVLTTGGILSSGAGNSALQGGDLSTPASEMVVVVNNALTMSSTLTNGGGTTTLIKGGSGVLTLVGTNTYTGRRQPGVGIDD
jgi:fibronectin-binding autotransporter adhesin